MQLQADTAHLNEYFETHNAKGTLVISALYSDAQFVHNEKRALTRFSPASTFKILNTLIAVEEGIVENLDSAFKWDKVIRDYSPWNQDQTLDSAFERSCVWCYQQIASKVGKEKYKHYIATVDYGKLASEFDLTSFWLGNQMQVSAYEQIKLLKQIYKRELPFKEASYKTLKAVMLERQTDKYALFAKTGWSARSVPQVGWYIGYIELKEETWFFATNIEIASTNDLSKRKSITMSALREVLYSYEL